MIKTLQQYVNISESNTRNVGKKIISMFRVSRQQYDNWILRKTPITVEFNPRSYKLINLWVGELKRVEKRDESTI